MEQQKLPNITIAIVLSILGFICCCIAGIPAILLGGIALFLLRNDENKYKLDPEGYSNFSQLKTAKIIAWIVLAIGILYLVMTIYNIQQMGGWDAYIEKAMEMSEQWQNQ
ncbi:CCC motif membrane protein [Maribacter algicola]|uniref:CCC motif membrane protein n=1 Tax=Meishania litoralis TaxID=3434685 RepID=A0ACC7LPN3_9FLAO